jgi:predicted unusual protein kinase regulating ubiquinone biosynthesis (AarF/ABC1/UbiB family)
MLLLGYCSVVCVYGPVWLCSTTDGVEHFVRILKCLGPTGIKLGQYLHQRPDIISPPYCSILSTLLDENVPVDVGTLPVPPGVVVHPVPLGTGSLAQVHRGVYKGKSVVVKMLLPLATREVEIDMYICQLVVRLMTLVGYFPFDWKSFADDIYRQLDLRQEASDMVYTRELFNTEHGVCVPEVFTQSQTSIVMQEAPGKPMYNFPTRTTPHKARMHAFCHMATHGDRRFHADLHDGNVFYDECTDTIWLLDFGICAHPPVEWEFPLPTLIECMVTKKYGTLLRLLCGPRADYDYVEHLFAQYMENETAVNTSIGSTSYKFFSFLKENQLVLSGTNVSFFSQLITLEKTVTIY